MKRLAFSAALRGCGVVLLAAALACGAGDGDSGGRRPAGPRPALGARGGSGAIAGSSTGFGNGGVGSIGQGGAAARAGSAPKGPKDCANARVNTSTTTPDILFVIDGSGSMCENFGNSTRWRALRTALLDPMSGLIQRLQASAVFGMVLYDGTIDLALALTGLGSGSPPTQCAGMYTEMKMTGDCPQLIQVPLALNNAAAIDMAFPMTELGGSTPTDKAMNFAVDLMVGMKNKDPDGEMHPQYIILATDGQPNDICLNGAGGDGSAQRQGVIAAVDRAKMNGITTFAISLAGKDATLQSHLEMVADHGNPADPNAHAFSPMTPDDLVTTLAVLLGGAIGCDISLDGMVVQGMECRGFVKNNGTELPCCESKGGSWTCDGAPVAAPNGWHLKDASTVELVGDTCTNFLRAPQSTLEAGFPCGVFVQ